MTSVSLHKALFGLGVFTAVAYIIVGIAGGIWPGHWDDTGATDQILWVVFGVGEGHPPRRAATAAPLADSGRDTRVCRVILGALPVFWTLIPLLLALVLIVLSVMYARRARVRRVSA